MNRLMMAGLVFILGIPLQMKQQKACEHAAPPKGMHWVCANNDPCDCHLATTAPQDEQDNYSSKTYAQTGAVSCLVCRVAFFAIPGYPEEARRTQKEGMVSASLVLTAEGGVEEVRIESGDPQLASAVQSAFQQWRFTPGKRSETIPVSVKFVLEDSPTGSVTGTSLLNTVVTAKPSR
jgi:TonB family protein